MNSGKIPPGHQRNTNLGDKANIISSWSFTTDINIPREVPLTRYHDYQVWWKEFHSDVQECGRQQNPPRNHLLRVIGGHITTIDSYPWMVKILLSVFARNKC